MSAIESLYTPDQTKQFLGFPRSQDVRELVRRGKLKAIFRPSLRGLGRLQRMLIPASAIVEYQRNLEPVAPHTRDTKAPAISPTEHTRGRRRPHLQRASGKNWV